MVAIEREKLLSNLETEDFVGRSEELDAVLRRAREDAGKTRGLLVSGAPGLGVSALLRQAYDRLFREQTEVIPVYFALRQSDKTARQAAARFLQTFLQQFV